MALLTTAIGAYPKPSYVPTPDWFRTGMDSAAPTKAYDDYHEDAPADLVALQDRATAEVVVAQVELGIDIPTDGEVRRENYIHYQCRNITGIDFVNLTRSAVREGSWIADVPTINAALVGKEPILARDFRVAQAATDRPVKMTLPGPMTILDSVVDAFYPDAATAGAALAAVLNEEVLALAAAGCTWIQLDEPVFARRPDQALDHGFANLELCFDGTPDAVTRMLHMCCGYPKGLDQENIEKADQGAYFTLAPAVGASSIDVVSIEDAHRRNDLSLLERFGTKTVALGSFDIASSRIETPELIADRLAAALEHIDGDRLIAAPDCGLGILGEELATSKLQNLVEAAQGTG